MGTRVITVRAAEDFSAAAAEGAAALQAGLLVGFATETVYGLGVLATDADALRRLRELKNRPTGPFGLYLADKSNIRRYVAEIPQRAAWLIERSWPGPVTVLLDTGGAFADDELHAAAGLFDVLTKDGVIGLRCPDEPVTRQMLAATKGPVIAASANPAGAPSPRNADEVLATLDGQIDLLIDSGPARYGKDSNMVLFNGQKYSCLRAGVFDEKKLEQMMTRKIAFVCTGNTCRSPIAAGLAKKLLAEQFNCAEDGLKDVGVEVISAGMFAAAGSGATNEAIKAAKGLGADISRHVSKKMTAELIKTCDMVFCMTEFHLQEARRLAGGSDVEIRLLDESLDVPDPIGGGLDVYSETAVHILRALEDIFNSKKT
ncbi:MAG: threonylcarbamoyl-AMP synthase [Phycisphaerae bacterium]|nr:threonylcarbamoyl-AMP synthase [Phycisphaerae bacterium]